MECDKCNGSGRLPDPPKPKITEYSLIYENSRGQTKSINRKNLSCILTYCNKNNVPPSKFKKWNGEDNWLCLGIRREGSGAIVDTQYIYKIQGKWYSSGHPKVWSKK